VLPLQASLNKLFRCQQQNFSPPPKFIVKNELHEGQWSRMSLRWVQPPLRWLEEIINWGSSVSKRGQCVYVCRPANNIIQDCKAQNGVWQKNVFVEWWLQCRETNKLHIYRLCVQDVGRSECVEVGHCGKELHDTC